MTAPKRKPRAVPRRRRGETLAETLVAVLISAVALVMLASMISTSSDLTLRSEKAMTSYYEKTDRFADPAASGSTTVSLNGAGAPGLTVSGAATSVTLTEDPISVNIYSTSIGRTTIYAYRMEP